MSHSVPRFSLTEKVYQHLKSQLARKQLNVGDWINSGKIAADLGVSRSTVSKAIERLVSEKFLVVDPARHPVVATLPTLSNVHEPQTFEFANQTESTYEILLLRILRGDYGPGEIIKEKRLAIEIGVNPITLHRAAEWLRKDGLLERLPRRGWRVAMLTTRDLREAYDIRLLLEPPAIATAVSNISIEELDRLSEQTDRLIALGDQATVYERREADHQFHKTICAASGNETLAEFLIPLIRRVLLITTLGFRNTRSLQSLLEHRRILDAMRARDDKEAAKLMRTHLRNAMAFNAVRWEQK